VYSRLLCAAIARPAQGFTLFLDGNTRMSSRHLSPASATDTTWRRSLSIDGQNWNVFAVHPFRFAIDRRIADGWLCFEVASGNARRRLSAPPEQWQSFSEAELIELWNAATEVRPI
jgi:hypothetical protein